MPSAAKRQRRVETEELTLPKAESNKDTLAVVTAVVRTSPQLFGMYHVL